MDFDDTPQEAEFRTEVRTWIEANAPEHLLPYLQNATFASLDLGPHDVEAESKAWRQKKYDAGWSCLSWPKEYGGRDASPIERVIWGQEEGAYGALSGMFGLVKACADRRSWPLHLKTKKDATLTSSPPVMKFGASSFPNLEADPT